jgi:glycosyltransferase involved in cell wall biosynthesis
MKIGLISSEIPPKINAGSVRMESFIEYWKENKGIELFIYTEKNNKKNIDFGKNVHIINSYFRRASNKNNIIIRVLSEIVLAIDIFFGLLKDKMDTYFVSSPSFLLLISVLIASKIKRTPYIVDIRDIYPQVIFDNNIINKNSYIGKFLVNIEKKIYDNASKIITVTKGLKNHIEEKTKTKVYLIRNGMDNNLFNNNYKSNKSRNKDFIIMFHGTLGRSQNIDLIIQYANYLKNNKIKDIKIWIIGDGPKKEKIINSINKLNLENNLIFHGFKDISQIPSYINSADIGFSPRKNGLINETAFPVKVYEYMGCGIPCIITPISEAGIFVEKNNIGFQLENNNIKSLHKYVLKFKNNKNLYNQYSINALKTSKQFERSKLAKRVYEIIMEE